MKEYIDNEGITHKDIYLQLEEGTIGDLIYEPGWYFIDNIEIFFHGPFNTLEEAEEIMARYYGGT